MMLDRGGLAASADGQHRARSELEPRVGSTREHVDHEQGSNESSCYCILTTARQPVIVKKATNQEASLNRGTSLAKPAGVSSLENKFRAIQLKNQGVIEFKSRSRSMLQGHFGEREGDQGQQPQSMVQKPVGAVADPAPAQRNSQNSGPGKTRASANRVSNIG